MSLSYGIFLSVVAIVILILIIDTISAPPSIRNMPEVKGLPIVGSIPEMKHNPSAKFCDWAQKYGDVYQIRVGDRRVVVANSYDSVKQLWLDNRAANNSRPLLYTFHSVVSKTQGFTVGTTPWGEEYKHKKKFVATNLNKTNVAGLSELLDAESTGSIDRIEKLLTQSEESDINLLKIVQGYHLKIALFLTYGYSIDYNTQLGLYLLDEITFVENKITRLRSHTSHPQDYIWLLKYVWPHVDDAKQFRARRDVYMSFFFDHVKNSCPDSECLVAKAWRTNQLSETELKSACLTMVSAGLDNTPLNFNYCIGMLSQPGSGFVLQNTARTEILKVYGSFETAWSSAPYENMKVGYVVALIKETLRYMSVLPLSLPRETTKDIVFRDCVIPAHTILFMNTYAANNDTNYFADPQKFEPLRWLNEDMTVNQSLTHFSFGLGTRMCAGSHLAYKEMYVMLMRFLIKYEVSPPSDPQKLMRTNIFQLNEVPDSIAIEPGPYSVKLRAVES